MHWCTIEECYLQMCLHFMSYTHVNRNYFHIGLILDAPRVQDFFYVKCVFILHTMSACAQSMYKRQAEEWPMHSAYHISYSVAVMSPPPPPPQYLWPTSTERGRGVTVNIALPSAPSRMLYSLAVTPPSLLSPPPLIEAKLVPKIISLTPPCPRLWLFLTCLLSLFDHVCLFLCQWLHTIMILHYGTYVWEERTVSRKCNICCYAPPPSK